MGWFMNVPSSNYRSFSGLWLRDLSRCEVVQTNRDGSIIVGVLNAISQSPRRQEVHVPQWLIALIIGKNCIPIRHVLPANQPVFAEIGGSTVPKSRRRLAKAVDPPMRVGWTDSAGRLGAVVLRWNG